MSPHLDLTAPYAPLVRRIETEATVERGEILRIDHFLNHRIEPGFIFELAHELARRLSFFQPNIILTAEASGIAPALIQFNPDDSAEYRTKRLAESALGIEPGAEVIYQSLRYLLDNPYVTGTTLTVNGGRHLV